jgi:hypothetical protein
MKVRTEATVDCVICNGLGCLSRKKDRWLTKLLDAAAIGFEFKKRIKAAEDKAIKKAGLDQALFSDFATLTLEEPSAELPLTDEDLQFLTHLKIKSE